MLRSTFQELLGCDMPRVMEFSGDAALLHHRLGKFRIISQMSKLGSLEPLAWPEP